MPTKKEILEADKKSADLDLRLRYLSHLVAGHVCQTEFYRQCPPDEGGCGEWSCKKFCHGVCVTCNARADYYKDTVKAKKRYVAYRKKNIDRIREWKKEWYQRNKDTHRHNVAAYNAVHRIERRMKAAIRFARTANVPLFVYVCDDCGHCLTGIEKKTACDKKKCGSENIRLIHRP